MGGERDGRGERWEGREMGGERDGRRERWEEREKFAGCQELATWIEKRGVCVVKETAGTFNWVTVGEDVKGELTTGCKVQADVC